MNEGNIFDYFYGAESDQFSFIRIPKLLLFDPKFSELSLGAVMLYGLLLDRMGLSARRKWIDEEGRVYIRYKIKNIEEDMNLSEKTATKYLTELEKIGLVEKVKVGLGQGNILYIKNFISKDLKPKAFITGKNYGNGKAKKDGKTTVSEESETKKTELTGNKPSKHHIPVFFAGNEAVDFGGNVTVKNGGNDTVDFAGHSDKNINNNKYNNNPNLIVSEEDDKFYGVYLSRFKRDHGSDEIGLIGMPNRSQIIREGIRNQVNYEYFQIKEISLNQVDEIIEIVVEMMLDNSAKIRISGKDYDAYYVKSRLFNLKYKHMEYILTCLRNTTTKIGNIRNYLRTTIFNSLTTVDNYYNAEVNHDLYGIEA